MKSTQIGPIVWLLIALACAAGIPISFIYVDVSVARNFIGNMGVLGAGLGSAVLLLGEAATALILVTLRLFRGRLSPLEEALALASLSSMCAYALNDGVLKVFFGVPNPEAVLQQGVRHTVNLLSGGRNSSFPSGHMVLAGAFGGVFMRLYPSSILPLSVLLFLGAALLVYGDWHFVSDVIAGALIGVSAGLVAGALWQAHTNVQSH